jgi:hypothetical protein
MRVGDAGARTEKTLAPERAAGLLVQRAGNGVPKAALARDYGMSRETVYQYPRHAKLGWEPPCRRGHYTEPKRR